MSDAGKYKIDEAEAAQLKDKVEGLRSGITEKAYHLVHVVMPQRVLALSELYNVCNLQHNVQIFSANISWKFHHHSY